MKTLSNSNLKQQSKKATPYFHSEFDSSIFIQESDSDANKAIRLIVEARSLLEQSLQTLMHGTLASSIEEIVALIKKATASGPNVALASIILCRSGRYSIVHSIASAILCERMARSMGYTEEELNTTISAALTMNISIFDIQDQLIAIKTPLSDAQKHFIQRHPLLTVELLRAARIQDEAWLSAILHHHEAHDGSGYPMGVKGDEIPKIARLLHLSDIFCARVAPRNYRRAIPGGDALRGLLLDRGHAISANLAAHFIRVIGLYPPGSLVELANGEIALVLAPSDHPGAPLVSSISDKDGAMQHPTPRDPRANGHHITGAKDNVSINKIISASDFWPG